MNQINLLDHFDVSCSRHLHCNSLLISKSPADETLRYFSLGEDDLARAHVLGKGSVRYILHHLSNRETVLYYHIRRG